MARIRTVKPELFKHEELFELEEKSGLPVRLAFIGLLTCCDREGRFKWRPRAIKLDVMPYDSANFADILNCLEQGGFVTKYTVDGEDFGCVPTFLTHQTINTREAKSTLPEPPVNARAAHVHAHEGEGVGKPYEYRGVNIAPALRETIIARDGACCKRCGATEDLTIDHIFPRSIGGTHAPANLRVLCRSCNSARPVAGQALIDDLAKDGFTLDDMQRTCMHVHAQGERKGKEGKEDSAELDPSNSTPTPPADLDLIGDNDGEVAAVVSIPLNDGTEYPVTQAMADEWALAYPAVDVLQKLREMRAWCLANKANRKTLRGVDAFIVRWLSKEQGRAPRVSGYAGPQPAVAGVGSFV